jgi:hypothetical protein
MSRLLVLAVLLAVLSSIDAAKSVRKAIVFGVDGGKASVFYDVLYNLKNASNLLELMNTGIGAKCQAPTDPTCGTSHEGNRYGSRPPATKTAYTTQYEWVTSPGWASVVTGVDTPKHNVRGNGPLKQVTFVTTSQYYPTMFQYAKTAGLKTAASGAPAFLSGTTTVPLVCDWGIVDYECGGSVLGPAVRCTDTNSCNLNFRLGLQEDGSQDLKTTAFGVQHIKANDADLIMTHFDLVDHFGHLFGWGSKEQKSQIGVVDSQIGQMLTAIKDAVKTRNESWIVLVTADHGGHNMSHGDGWIDDEAVPFIVAAYGPEAPAKMNPLIAPRHFDVMPTVLAWLGVKASSTIPIDGRVQGIPQPSWGELRDARD